MQSGRCGAAGVHPSPAAPAARCRHPQKRHAAACRAARPRGSSSEEGGGNGSSGGGVPPLQRPAAAGERAGTTLSLDVTSLEFPPAGTAAAAAGPAAAAAGNRPGGEGKAAIKTTGLRRTPLGSGVQNATLRCDLPSPAVAVRNLVEQAQYAHLCTIMSGMHHRRAGYPFGTLVDFAADGAGYPIFSLSPLAIQTRNIMEDPRCSLVVQMAGWAGLANARVTIFGDVYKLPTELQEQAREIFHAKHAATAKPKERWVSGNTHYFRMNRILDIYFVGGFGTVQWVEPGEYAAAVPDSIVLATPNQTLQALNEAYSAQVRELLSRPGHPADDAAFISVDRLGADVRVRTGGEYSVERIGFDMGVESLEDAMAAMQRIMRDPNCLLVEG